MKSLSTVHAVNERPLTTDTIQNPELKRNSTPLTCGLHIDSCSMF